MIEAFRRLALALALVGYSCTGGGKPPQPPQVPQPQCIEGQACGCWHHPPEALGWLYACCQPGVPGGVVSVQDPAQCIGAQPPADVKFPELALQTSGFALVRGGQPHSPLGAIQCCMPAPAVVGNSRWPLASESWMDYAKGDYYHFRMGPFYATAETEAEWADVGGPYIGDGPEFNAAFWSKVRELASYAGSKKANVEVVPIDTWYCKHAASNWGDQRMPWPQADIDACGKNPSPEQERYLRKVVSELGCFANVTWLTDNEGGEITGTKREWYEWVRSVIRDEEQKTGCAVVHLVGTNNTDFCDGPFDYCATHARAALTEPIAGKHTSNNERNPQFSVKQEHSNFVNARAAGLNYWYWRAEQTEEQMAETLALFRGETTGTVGCFAPEPDDPLWVEPPTTGGGEMRAAVEAAKMAVGEHCGTDHQGSLATLGLLADELRKQGHCASGAWTDAVAILAPSGKWEEYHAVTFATGCWAQDPAQLPKFTWVYGGENPNPGCPGDVAATDEILCKLHQPGQGLWDCTPKANGQPIRPEGDPTRAACEKKSMGGAYPAYVLAGNGIQLEAVENPMQFKITGSGSGVVTCTTPSSAGSNLCLSPAREPLAVSR